MQPVTNGSGSVFKDWVCIFPGKMGISWKLSHEATTREEAEIQAAKNCNVVAVPLQLYEKMRELEDRMMNAERKKLFVVIDVEQNYDYVENARCVAAYRTQEDAERLVARLKEMKDKSHLDFTEYVKKFVADIEMPVAPNYEQWQEFVKKAQNTTWFSTFITTATFRKDMEGFLYKGYKPGLPNYNPPEVIHKYQNLFVVETLGDETL